MAKTVGILGGMGPAAAHYFLGRVIDLTPATDDIDHVHTILDNNPKVPSRIAAILEGSPENPAPTMAQIAAGLEQAGSDFIVIPCNTAHYYHSDVQAAIQIPVWHAIEMSLQSIRAAHPDLKRLGLLASSATHKIKLFEPFFAQAGFELVYPDQEVQNLVMQVIRAVKAQALTDDLFQQYLTAVQTMTGAQGFLIACSELSMHFSSHDIQQPCFDTMEILAHKVVEAAQ